MPFQSQKKPLELSEAHKKQLQRAARSRTESLQRVERARILLAYAREETVSAIARMLGTNRQKVNRCIDKALQLGAEAALSDLPGRGRKRLIGRPARAWLVSLACRKAKELGYAQELWTTHLLAQHARRHCRRAGHPSLAKIGRGTVSKILSAKALKPHKVRYYVEKRDPDFDAKMARVLCVYKQVQLLREKGQPQGQSVAVLSYDEKPQIQAIGGTGVDRPPVPGQHSSWLRDYEYVRHGTVSLLAGIDLLSGHVHGLVTQRHRSLEFIQFLRQVDAYYPAKTKIRLILDNHSAHLSKETRSFLATRPNRFEFIFTPTHGSWLNLIESFFAKMAKIFLRGLQVSSKKKLQQRLEQYLEEINETPVVFRWKYGLEPLSKI